MDIYISAPVAAIFVTLISEMVFFNDRLLITVIFAIGYGAHVAQQSPAAAKMFGLTSLGSIFGVLTLGLTSGIAVGPVLAGYIFDVSGGYKFAFIVTILVCITGLILTAMTKTTLSKRTSKLE